MAVYKRKYVAESNSAFISAYVFLTYDATDSSAYSFIQGYASDSAYPTFDTIVSGIVGDYTSGTFGTEVFGQMLVDRLDGANRIRRTYRVESAAAGGFAVVIDDLDLVTEAEGFVGATTYSDWATAWAAVAADVSALETGGAGMTRADAVATFNQ